MAGSTFLTNLFDLYELLDSCAQGPIQLRDFQRSWVRGKDRIASLIASISRAFPVGALMTLDTGGSIIEGRQAEEGEDVEVDEDAMEAGLTIAAAPGAIDSAA